MTLVLVNHNFKPFVVVEFTSEKDAAGNIPVEIVPTAWLTPDQKETHWPPSILPISQLVQRQAVKKPNWGTCQVTILKYCGK